MKKLLTAIIVFTAVVLSFAALTACSGSNGEADLKAAKDAQDKGDFETALPLYQKAAKAGNAEAQFNLGFIYETGMSGKTDEKEAVVWYRKSAEQGYHMAQLALGDCYRRGCGVEADKEEAKKWLQKSADQGNEQAKQTLSLLDMF
jgi:TPR repeat protein